MANVLRKKTNQIPDEKQNTCFNGDYLVACACRSILPVIDRRTGNITVVILGVKHSVFFENGCFMSQMSQ